MNSTPLQTPNGDSALESTATPLLLSSTLTMDPPAPHDIPQTLNLTREGLLEREVHSLTRKVAKLTAKCQDVAQLVSLYNNLLKGTLLSWPERHGAPFSVSDPFLANRQMSSSLLVFMRLEHEAMKKEFQGLITVSQDNAQGEVDRVTQLLRESEKARSSASNQISEQAIVVSQLQSQLMEARSQLAIVGDGSEQKKEMVRLKSAVEAKDRQLKKAEERSDMQKVEMANLTHKVKSLERGMKQMRDSQGFEPAARAPVPEAPTATINNETSTNIDSTPIDQPKPKAKRTSSRSKRKRNDDELSARSSTDQESDLEMASLFMEDFDMDAEEEAAAATTASLPKRKKSKKVVDEEDSAWTPTLPISSSTRKEIVPSDPVVTRQSRRNSTSTSASFVIHNAVPESALMPPPPTPIVAGSAVRIAKKAATPFSPPSNAPRSAVTHATPSATQTREGLSSNASSSNGGVPVATPTVPLTSHTSPHHSAGAPSVDISEPQNQDSSSSLNVRSADAAPHSSSSRSSAPRLERATTSAAQAITDSISEPSSSRFASRDASGFLLPTSPASSLSSTESAKKTRKSSKRTHAITYELAPVQIYWTPLTQLSEATSAIAALLVHLTASNGSYPSDETKFMLATLAGRLCRTSPTIFSEAVAASLQSLTATFIRELAHVDSTSKEYIEAVSSGRNWEEPLMNLFQTTSAGTFITTPTKFLEAALNTLQKLIHRDSTSEDAEIAPLVRLYVSLCRKLNSVCRARFMVFDLLRSRKDVPMLSILAIARSWPLAIEGKGCTLRGYVSCTIEAIVSQHLLTGGSHSALAVMFREETDWKSELNESHVADKWATLLISYLRRVFNLPQAPTNAISAEKILSTGSDLIRSLELILPRIDAKFGSEVLWKNLLAPILASLPQRSLSESSAKSVSLINVQATLALAASTALARAQHKSSDFVSFICATLATLLGAAQPLPFSLQLLVFDAMLEILASPSASHCRQQNANGLRQWMNALPMIQRQHIPTHLERLLIRDSEDQMV